MELKFSKTDDACLSLTCSNRTFMELKLSTPYCKFLITSAGSNRTFMELKLEIAKAIKDSILSSNRTFMELK